VRRVRNRWMTAPTDTDTPASSPVCGGTARRSVGERYPAKTGRKPPISQTTKPGAKSRFRCGFCTWRLTWAAVPAAYIPYYPLYGFRPKCGEILTGGGTAHGCGTSARRRGAGAGYRLKGPCPRCGVSPGASGVPAPCCYQAATGRTGGAARALGEMTLGTCKIVDRRPHRDVASGPR